VFDKKISLLPDTRGGIPRFHSLFIALSVPLSQGYVYRLPV